MVKEPEEPDSDTPFTVSWGGRVTIADWIAWPAFGMVSLLALIPGMPIPLGFVAIGIGTLAAAVLLMAASSGAFIEDAWVEGSRIQLPLMLFGFVLGTLSVFAGLFTILSKLDIHAFNQPVGGMTAMYFSTAAWTTAGFGDIYATSGLSKLLVTIEMLLGTATVLIILGTAASKAFARTSRRWYLKLEESDDPTTKRYKFVQDPEDG